MRHFRDVAHRRTDMVATSGEDAQVSLVREASFFDPKALKLATKRQVMGLETRH